MEKRVARITTAVTKEEHKLIEQKALENHQTISDFVRQVCLNYKNKK